MSMPEADFAPVRFSTADLPPRDQIPICREVFGRQMVGVDVEPIEERPFELTMTIRRLPALRVGTLNSQGVRLSRRLEFIADNDDVFTLFTEFGEASTAAARGRNVTLEHGQAVLIQSIEPSVTTHSNTHLVGATVPRAAIAPLVANVDDATVRLIPANREALQLLSIYLRIMCEGLPLRSPELQHLTETHILDLIALAIGANRDGAALAQSRGLSAARLVAIKADIIANLGRRDLSPAFIARRQGLSERHIRRLFRAEDTSFSDYVLEQRLLRAYHMLCDPRFAKRTVSVVAYECGFGDLSYFNRCFRRRFGASPKQFRG